MPNTCTYYCTFRLVWNKNYMLSEISVKVFRFRSGRKLVGPAETDIVLDLLSCSHNFFSETLRISWKHYINIIVEPLSTKNYTGISCISSVTYNPLSHFSKLVPIWPTLSTILLLVTWWYKISVVGPLAFIPISVNFCSPKLMSWSFPELWIISVKLTLSLWTIFYHVFWRITMKAKSWIIISEPCIVIICILVSTDWNF